MSPRIFAGAARRTGIEFYSTPVAEYSKSSVGATTPRTPLCEELAPRLWAVRHESRVRFLEVRLAHLPYVVNLGLFPNLSRIQAIYSRRIQAEHLSSHFCRDRRIAILILELLGYLESPKSLDLILRTSVPEAIGSPTDLILAQVLEELPKKMSSLIRTRLPALSPPGAEISVKV